MFTYTLIQGHFQRKWRLHCIGYIWCHCGCIVSREGWRCAHQCGHSVHSDWYKRGHWNYDFWIYREWAFGANCDWAVSKMDEAVWREWDRWEEERTVGPHHTVYLEQTAMIWHFLIFIESKFLSFKIQRFWACLHHKACALNFRVCCFVWISVFELLINPESGWHCSFYHLNFQWIYTLNILIFHRICDTA